MNQRLKALMTEAGFVAPELAGRAQKLVGLILQDITTELESIQVGDYSHDDYDKGYDSALMAVTEILNELYNNEVSNQLVLRKEYCGEGIIDMSQDIDEMFDSNINPAIGTVPVDDHGIFRGTFQLTVTWKDDED